MTDEFNKLKEEYTGFSMDERKVRDMKSRINQAKAENRIKAGRRHAIEWAVAAAAALAVCALPNTNVKVADAMGNIPVIGGFFRTITIRDFHEDNERQKADVSVRGLDSESKAGKDTADEVNKEIKTLTDKYVADFKENVKDNGMEHLKVDTKIICRTDRYFTLRLSALMTQADSYEENHYYTIDIKSGKQIKLENLFKDGADYKTAIREDVKKQMLDQMKESKDNMYWIGDTKANQKEMDFKESDLTDKASFYLNKNGDIVICYNQGDVAPMYMGALKFTIDKDAVADILK